MATPEQQAYISGKRYEAEKNLQGRPRVTTPDISNTERNLKDSINGRTREKLAAEFGVGKNRFTKDYNFAKGVDAVREVSPDLAEKIFSREGGTSAPWEALVKRLPASCNRSLGCSQQPGL